MGREVAAAVVQPLIQNTDHPFEVSTVIFERATLRTRAGRSMERTREEVEKFAAMMKEDAGD